MLQFNNRLFEVKLMFHPLNISHGMTSVQCGIWEHTKSRICIRLLVVTRFIRLHPGAQKGNAANYCSLFEPHYKQNLYTNPKRTAKSSNIANSAQRFIDN